MREKIARLKNGKWRDKYFCKLSLLDHLRECLEKDNYLKATDCPKNSIGYENLDKELMDLKIILNFYFSDSEELYNKRLDKFIANLEK
jgi:hypothetical protein